MTGGFPHSDISGSKVIWHLAETYRSHITSFIASWSQGIHHTPLHSCKEHCTPLYILFVWFENTKIEIRRCVFVGRGRKDPGHKTKILTRPTFTYWRFWLSQKRHTTCASNTRGFLGTDLINRFLRICDYQRSRTPLSFKKSAYPRQENR